MAVCKKQADLFWLNNILSSMSSLVASSSSGSRVMEKYNTLLSYGTVLSYGTILSYGLILGWKRIDWKALFKKKLLFVEFVKEKHQQGEH